MLILLSFVTGVAGCGPQPTRPTVAPITASATLSGRTLNLSISIPRSELSTDAKTTDFVTCHRLIGRVDLLNSRSLGTGRINVNNDLSSPELSFSSVYTFGDHDELTGFDTAFFIVFPDGQSQGVVIRCPVERTEIDTEQNASM